MYTALINKGSKTENNQDYSNAMKRVRLLCVWRLSTTNGTRIVLVLASDALTFVE